MLKGRLENSIKMDLEEVGCENINWIELSQGSLVYFGF
jgi:hypothetical protein